MLNHWDNMDGSIERGYAGGSFFGTDISATMSGGTRYGRLASVGISMVSINNVNVQAPADLITEACSAPACPRHCCALRHPAAGTVDYPFPAA